MGYLAGFDEYLAKNYDLSIFDTLSQSTQTYNFHIHGKHIYTGNVIKNDKYDVEVLWQGQKEKQIVPKIQIKFLYAADLGNKVVDLIRINEKVKAATLQPIYSPSKRRHIKNKTLYPLMIERRVLFFTLLEGEVLKGIVRNFNRYEITLHMKGGLPVVILRHSIFDVRDKRGRCFLKSYQEKYRDWEKSPLYIQK